MKERGTSIPPTGRLTRAILGVAANFLLTFGATRLTAAGFPQQ